MKLASKTTFQNIYVVLGKVAPSIRFIFGVITTTIGRSLTCAQVDNKIGLASFRNDNIKSY